MPDTVLSPVAESPKFADCMAYVLGVGVPEFGAAGHSSFNNHDYLFIILCFLLAGSGLGDVYPMTSTSI